MDDQPCYPSGGYITVKDGNGNEHQEPARAWLYYSMGGKWEDRPRITFNPKKS